MAQPLYAKTDLHILGRDIPAGAPIPDWVPKDRIDRGLRSGLITSKAPRPEPAPPVPGAPIVGTVEEMTGPPAEGIQMPGSPADMPPVGAGDLDESTPRPRSRRR